MPRLSGLVGGVRGLCACGCARYCCAQARGSGLASAIGLSVRAISWHMPLHCLANRPYRTHSLGRHVLQKGKQVWATWHGAVIMVMAPLADEMLCGRAHVRPTSFQRDFSLLFDDKSGPRANFLSIFLFVDDFSPPDPGSRFS